MFCHLCEKKSDYLVCLEDIDKTQVLVHEGCAIHIAGNDWKQYSKGCFEIDSYDGTKCWYLNGKFHRLDGPAIDYADGEKHWYLNGELHRVDGPAIERADGAKEWYLHGKIHRLDGPAVCTDTRKSWYINGKRHREDGPAIEHANGHKWWFLNNKELSESKFNRKKIIYLFFKKLLGKFKYSS